ncbi:hypothetical protein N7540_007422 [Penicillium herquei]|nr:hypothetical protein N7540_007422 [Penicillium herquei]
MSTLNDTSFEPVFSGVPRDNRIPLVHKTSDFIYCPHTAHNVTYRMFFLPQAFGELLNAIRYTTLRCTEDSAVRCDLRIMDHVMTRTSNCPRQIAYRMGGEESSFKEYDNPGFDNTYTEQQKRAFISPWRRIIFYKGLSTTLERIGAPRAIHWEELMDPTLNKPAKEALACIGIYPFPPPDKNPGFQASAGHTTYEAVIEAAILHLNGSPRTSGDRINPYLDASRSFHITFYEILHMETSESLGPGHETEEKILKEETWKTGHLYINPTSPRGTKAPVFRRSAFTILVATEDLNSTPEKARCPDLSPEWGTMLVLCPSLTSKWCNMKREEVISPKWKAILEYNKVRVGEIAVITEEYKILPHRWSQLVDHITSLLEEDFMDPESYVKLIFDDDQLSTSKKYFWILACIQEFRTHIVDNIQQWNLYYNARLKPFSGAWPQELTELVRHIEQSCSALDGIKREMDDIAETVKARRDGLFNASALSESRNSNRLGQNVKLLTYVSIFYLPLAFCAALWAIPNISMSDTRAAFIVTSVLLGLINFLVVANLNNISRNLGNTYNIWRARVVQEMKDDFNERWHQDGQRLDNSWPEQSKTPSEWLILQYQIYRVFKLIPILPYLRNIKVLLQRQWNSTRNNSRRSTRSSDSDLY